MKKEAKKTNEAQLLDLLKRVLPKATHDAQLAGKIYQAIELEFKAKARALAFEKFCGKVELPNLDQKTVEDVKLQLAASFGDGDITLKPNKKEQSLMVEVSCPMAISSPARSRSVLWLRPPVRNRRSDLEICALPRLPAGRPGTGMAPGCRARTCRRKKPAIALCKMEDEFWASKTGQKLIRDRVERNFPEFIARVPGGLLNEVGLKRHYNTPEPVKQLRKSLNH